MPSGAYTPVFEVRKGGENITANFQNRAVSIDVELCSGDGAQDTCTIVVDDRDWLISRPNVGDAIQVLLGYQEVGTAFMGTFEVDEVVFSYPPKQILIHGNSLGFVGPIKSQTTRNFEGKTLGEIIKDYAGKLGLSATVDSELSGLKIPYLNATNSPMHVFQEFEKLYGGVLKISGGQLTFGKRDSGMTASGEEMPLVVLRPEHIANCRVKHVNRGEYSKTVARYKDPTTHTEKSVEAQSSVSDKIVRDENGKEQSTPFTITQLFPTKEAAEKAAQAQQAAMDRTLGEGLFTLARGDPWVRDGNRILVTGTRDGIDGSYVTDIVRHSFSHDTGLTTSISTKAPGQGEANFASLYEGNPSAALAPAPGQVVGDVLPQSVDHGNANPAAPAP
ncbi:hypothetical protein MKL09_14405 [Methylobacterium sp. J-048]|uniref:phage late control D family protein n=1 Tax=Methylobacterium sp. J-048 TaxID=2836635 RepID=UPI001FBA1111|nr:hypothetical protein [Methylobacterium sp. J-048]MCJ2057743.1 hypothetical protein [Methylobacterium sp. J-048]